MKVGWPDRGIWGSSFDLLDDLSALSSYEDALAEAVYEELDYLLTQKEGLGSPGECLCLPPGSLVASTPWLCTSSQHLQTPCVPQAHRDGSSREAEWLSEPRDLPASVCTAGAWPVPSQR